MRIHSTSCRSFLPALALAAVVAGGFSGVARGQTLRSTLVQGGFTQPLYLTSPPGDTHRLFVVEHAGIIKIIKDGALLPTPFMNIDAIVGGGQATSDERGLLGLAFHPQYASNGRFYVAYTDNSNAEVMREYHVSGNPDIADTATFTTLFGPYPDPQSNHNGSCLQFGADGMLYYSLGDGGNANDMGSGHDPSTGNAQSMNTYFGKMLRLDPDNAPTYVPAGNPFPASSIPLAWAIGLRNPWRFSFDRLTGDMYIADVGQGAWEEIDFQPAASTGGENYGWRCMEGNHCTGFTGCTCNAPNLKIPIQEYSHSSGCSITGGFMYRGAAIPAFQGQYIYADYCSGQIWSFAYNGTTVSNFVNRTAQLDPAGALSINSVTSFGQDANGELYICDFGGGEIYRIDTICPDPTIYCTAAPNSAGPGAFMAVSGTGSFASNDLHLFTSGCPSTVFGFYFYGTAQANVPTYNGFRCVGGTIKRLPTVQTSQFGDADWTFDVHAPPAVVQPGSTWYFQLFYRDPGVGTGLNYSDAVTVPFCN
jgi:glucose/arabinose dehydrogenase